MKVTCKHKNSKIKKQYDSIVAGFPSQSHQNQIKSNQPLPLNVILIGFDSLSRTAFERFMPDTSRFLKEQLHAAFFERHTIVGDGTPPGIHSA